MGNPDIFIFGYIVPNVNGDGTLDWEPMCPTCFEKAGGEVLTGDVILRSENAKDYPNGLDCAWCGSTIFFSKHVEEGEPPVDRLDVFRKFVETLDF